MPCSNSGVQRVEVDVLDAQQEAPVRARRPFAVEQWPTGMAEMQLAVGARREAEDRLAHC